MLTLLMIYRRIPWLGKMFMIALFLFVFISTIVRTVKATHAIQERNTSVHTHRTNR